VTVARPLILVMTAATAGFLALVIVTVVRSRQTSRAFAGAYGAGGSHTVPVGSEGIVKRGFSPLGVVFALGEEWTARVAGDDPVDPGAHIRVVGQDGLTLLVEPDPTAAPQEEDTTT
jgi:membrane-bound ClpP family serine protease